MLESMVIVTEVLRRNEAVADEFQVNLASVCSFFGATDFKWYPGVIYIMMVAFTDLVRICSRTFFGYLS